MILLMLKNISIISFDYHKTWKVKYDNVKRLMTLRMKLKIEMVFRDPNMNQNCRKVDLLQNTSYRMVRLKSWTCCEPQIFLPVE